jgi:hypothetical protein
MISRAVIDFTDDYLLISSFYPQFVPELELETRRVTDLRVAHILNDNN